VALATQPNSSETHPGIIVVVDDEPLVLRGLTRSLEHLPFIVVPCLTPREAIDHVASGHVRVVVSDISMEEMSGIELLRTIREHDPDLPVVLVTGCPEIGTATKALEYGAFRYLIKPVDVDELTDTVRRAAQLYRLAQARRQALQLFGDPGIDHERSGLEMCFERALGSLWLAYQPIVRASDHSIFGFEALLRSYEPTLATPESMLRAAERLGALDRLGRTVRNQAALTLAAAQRSYALFVNLHPQDLLDVDLSDAQAALTNVAGRVVLEVTERASIKDFEQARTKVAALRDQGFRIAIDDLGAGYSGLNAFALLEPEFVKLDMTLVRNVDRSTVKQKLVKSIATSCRDLGLYVVAEGVETREERDAAIDLGCDLLQGFLFARPGPAFPSIAWR
jgi:EAL domain-containing protein (putative c-di-GMP-specific phosphodiesterase class I)